MLARVCAEKLLGVFFLPAAAMVFFLVCFIRYVARVCPSSQSFTYQLPACVGSNHRAASSCRHIVQATLDLRRCLHFFRVEELEAPPAAHQSHLSKRESNLLLSRAQSEECHILWQHWLRPFERIHNPLTPLFSNGSVSPSIHSEEALISFAPSTFSLGEGTILPSACIAYATLVSPNSNCAIGATMPKAKN